MRKQTKIAAIASAAALLAIGASMTALAVPGWNDLGNGNYEYHDKDDIAVTDEWHDGYSTRNGQRYYYYLDDSGLMARDQLIEYNGNLYYVNPDGERVSDYWLKVPNTDGIVVNEYEPVNLYYYFNAHGQAVTGKQTVRKSNSDATTSIFWFDSEYHMISGWYDDSYYCSGEDEGYVLTDWQYLDKPLTDEWDNPYDYEDKAWYYFGSDGKMKTGRQWLPWEGKSSYYVFAENGQLLENGWSSANVATDPNATPSDVKAYYVDGGARAKGWVEADYDGSDSTHSTTWFYVESNGVPFNYNGKDSSGGSVMTMDGKVYTRVAARIVDGKTYLFNEFGEYMTGIYKIVVPVTRKGSTNPLKANEIYYFSETTGDPKGSMVTKKVQKTVDDIVYNYYFKADGTAAAGEIAGGVLYDYDGKRVDAEDGAWQVIEINGTVMSDKKDSGGNPKELTNVRIIVNTSGRVKESGTVTIDGVKYYIKSAAKGTKDTGYNSDKAKDGKLTEAISGDSYVIVHEYNVD